MTPGSCYFQHRVIAEEGVVVRKHRQRKGGDHLTSFTLPSGYTQNKKTRNKKADAFYEPLPKLLLEKLLYFP